MIRYKRGSVWMCQLDILGAKVRPCVIISNDEYNFDNSHPYISVVPLSTSIDIDKAGHVQMTLIDEKLCNVLVDFTSPCHKGQFLKFMGILDDKEMNRIIDAFNEHFRCIGAIKKYKQYSEEPNEDEKEVIIEVDLPAPATQRIGQIKYSIDDKRRIVSAYTDAMKNNDVGKIKQMSEIYGSGNINKLKQNIKYYKKCIRQEAI